MLRSWLAARLVERNLAALNRGDVRSTLAMYAPDVRFRFPGTSSWGADITGRHNVESWQQRMVLTGLQHRAEQVVANGPLWRMNLILRGTDFAQGPDGRQVYENRYVIWATTRWARVSEYEVYEDTEKVMGFDAYLAVRGSGTGAVSSQPGAVSSQPGAVSS